MVNKYTVSYCQRARGHYSFLTILGDCKKIVSGFHMTEIMWLRDYDEIPLKSDTWNRALGKSENNNLFLTWEWLSTWWKHFGDRNESLLLVVKKDDDVIAIAPLMYSRHRVKLLNLGFIQFMGTGLSDYSDFILVKDKEKCMNLIFDFLEKQPIEWDLMDLRNIPGDSSTVSLLQNLARERGYTIIMKETVCQHIPLNHTWEEYFKNLSSSMRKQLRQNLRRINETYSMNFRFAENLESSTATFFDTYLKWLTKRHSQSSLFDIPFPDIKEFLTDFAVKFFKKGWINLSFMMLDQKPASSYYFFIYNKCLYLYMTSWNPSYSYYGIGNVHTMNLIKQSIELGLERFDLLRGDEPYKARWNTSRRTNIRVLLLKRSLKGRLCHMLLNAMQHHKVRKSLEFFDVKGI